MSVYGKLIVAFSTFAGIAAAFAARFGDVQSVILAGSVCALAGVAIISQFTIASLERRIAAFIAALDAALAKAEPTS